MKIIYRIFVVILIICIPLTSIFAAYNIALRLPDLYIYEFNKTEITSEIDLAVTDEELGIFFSDFMSGKHKDFDLNAEYRDREQSVFNETEQVVMSNLREVLNLSIWIMIIMLILILVIYWLLLVKKQKWMLRYAFKGGVITFIILAAMMIAAFNIPIANEFMVHSMMMDVFNENDVLPLMLTSIYARDCLVAGTVISIILLILFGSITWKLTKPRRMFR